MKTVVIFGGSGFIGQHIARRMAKNGYKIIIPYQRTLDEAKLRFLGDIGSIFPIKFKRMTQDNIAKFIKTSNVVINLKTLWHEKPISFEKGIYDFNDLLVKQINEYDKKKLLIYFSGLGITSDSNSIRSKIIAKTEENILKNMRNGIIIRPGLVFGIDDNFLKKLIPLFKLSPIIPIFGNGNAKLQPVFVNDVVKAVETIIAKNNLESKIYELYGTDTFTYKFLYRYLAKSLGLSRIFLPFPFFLAKILVYLIQKISKKLITLEQLKLFEYDNLPSNKTGTFRDLDIKPQNILQTIKIIVEKY